MTPLQAGSWQLRAFRSSIGIGGFSGSMLVGMWNLYIEKQTEGILNQRDVCGDTASLHVAGGACHEAWTTICFWRSYNFNETDNTLENPSQILVPYKKEEV